MLAYPAYILWDVNAHSLHMRAALMFGAMGGFADVVACLLAYGVSSTSANRAGALICALFAVNGGTISNALTRLLFLEQG
jgi:hypothetical protein